MRLRTLSLSPASWDAMSMGGLTTSCHAPYQNAAMVWAIPARTMMWTVGGMSVESLRPTGVHMINNLVTRQRRQEEERRRRGDPVTPAQPGTYDEDLLHLADGRNRTTDGSVAVVSA